MSTVALGANIGISTDVPEAQAPETPIEAAPPVAPPASLAYPPNMEDVINRIRAEMQVDFNIAVADIERRLGQARELERSALYSEPRMLHAEDLDITRHLIDGYTLTANSPSAGYIAWSSLHIVYMGVDYTAADGNTNKKYTWFVKPASGTTVTLTSSDTMPVLGANDALIFVNNGGTPVSVLESSVSYAVGAGVIGQSQLAPDVTTILSNLQASDVAMQAAIDGTITSYYQANAPWPDGSPSPAGGNINQGDIWYDSDNGWTYRWTGAGGTPANTWFRIADTDIALIQGKVNTKTTTYLSVLASPPVAPSGGFTTGDLWMVTDQGNLIKRWSGSAWVDLQIGDGAISGVSGAKIGTGINGSNVTTGTVPAARIGAGVNGAVLTTATGTIGSTQIGSNAVTPAKINAAFHMLY